MMAGMNLPTADQLDQLAEVGEQHSTAVLIGAGVLLVVLTALGIWARRRATSSAIYDGAAVVVAIALSAEGMWEAATEELDLGPGAALLLFAFAELAMLRAARRAKAKVEKGDRPGQYGLLVWIIAAGAGLAAASASANKTEVLIRVGAPLLVAAQWWVDLMEIMRETLDAEDEDEAKRRRARQRSSFRWTPRRIGIHLGLIEPGEQDLVTVDRDRRINQLTVTAHRLHHGSPRLARWRRARLRRLALRADDQMVVETQQRVARVHRVEELTSPDARPAVPVDDATRDQLDEIRLITRQATDRLRTDHRRAFGTDQSADHRTIGGIRMPAHIADQIPDHPPAGWVDRYRTRSADQVRTAVLDHPVDQSADHTVDQVDTPGPDQIADQVDQAPTGAIPASARPALGQRTTVRVDRARPVSPATGDAVPPKVREMAKALAKRYRGDIPARSVVMQAMGWSSVDYTGKAIKLVREERAARTTQ